MYSLSYITQRITVIGCRLFDDWPKIFPVRNKSEVERVRARYYLGVQISLLVRVSHNDNVAWHHAFLRAGIESCVLTFRYDEHFLFTIERRDNTDVWREKCVKAFQRCEVCFKVRALRFALGTWTLECR